MMRMDLLDILNAHTVTVLGAHSTDLHARVELRLNVPSDRLDNGMPKRQHTAAGSSIKIECRNKQCKQQQCGPCTALNCHPGCGSHCCDYSPVDWMSFDSNPDLTFFDKVVLNEDGPRALIFLFEFIPEFS